MLGFETGVKVPRAGRQEGLLSPLWQAPSRRPQQLDAHVVPVACRQVRQCAGSVGRGVLPDAVRTQRTPRWILT